MKEQVPLSCSHCQSVLAQPGTVVAWKELPEKMIGHIEQGKEGVVFSVDQTESNPEIQLQCGDCGNLLELTVEDYYLDQEYVMLDSDKQD